MKIGEIGGHCFDDAPEVQTPEQTADALTPKAEAPIIEAESIHKSIKAFEAIAEQLKETAEKPMKNTMR